MSNLAAPDSPSDDTSVEISNANYHFDAPTYFDFSVPSDAPLNDQWFDEHNDSASTAHDDGYTLGEDVSQTGYSAAEQTPASSYSGRGSQASTGYRVHSAEATPSTALAGLSLQSQLEEAMTHARNPSDAAAIAALCGAKLSIASASSNRPSVASNAPSQSPVKALPLQFIDFSHLQPVEAKVELPAAERASTGSRKRKSDANARMAAKPPQPKKEKTATTTAKVNAPVASVGARKPVSRPISKAPTVKPVVSKAPAASNTAVLGQKRKSVPFAPKTATAGPSPVVRAAMNKVAGKSVLLAVVKAINNNIAVPIKRVAAPTESKTTAARENSRRNQTRNADKAAAPMVSKSRPAVAAAGASAAMRAKSSAPAAQPVRKASASVAATKHVVPPRVASASTVAAAAKVAKPKVVAKAAPAPQPRPKITVPKSPKLHVATRVKAADTLSSEEQMLKEMEEAKKQQEMVRKQNAAAVQRVLQPVGQILPTRSTKQLTQPQEFQLFTETRSRRVGKSAEPSTPSMGLSKKPISRQAVSQSADRRKKSPAAMKKPTQPVPFHFELDKRTHKAEAPAPVETPRRITHITRDLEIPVVPSSASKAPLGPDGKPMLTKPISPSLATKARVRAPAVLSFAEQEELEMQQMPKFKARKLNEAVMQSVGDLGLPKVSKPAPTEFQEFHLLTEDRARSRPEAHGELHAPSPFKARPFNPKLFEEVSNEDSKDAPRGVPAVPKKDLTVPVSPNITHPQPRKRKSEEGLQPEFKARPMPENSPFRPVLAKKTKLNVQPFNLLTEERGAQYQSHFQQQLAEEEAAARAAREFRAAPIVEASPMRPEKSNKPLTDPEPFPLQSITRHEANQLRFLEKVHQDIENELAQFSAFKARPMPHADPFLVKKAEKPLTEVEEFELYTELRSKERQTFDEHNKARLAEQERRKQEEEEAAKRQAEVEIAEMRKHMVHKALPIMKGEPLPPAKCDKPLTEPKSPELATKARAVVRKGKEEAVNDENIVLNSADLETY